MYDIDELREQTYVYVEDPAARILCPDCRNRKSLTIAGDQPCVAGILSFCALCDGARVITKARALAVLPHIVERVRELEVLVGEKE